MSVEGGCVPGPKKEEDCTDLSGTTICTCNKHLCNGNNYRLLVSDSWYMTTEKTTTPTKQTNGLKNLFTDIWNKIVLKHLEI